MISLESKELVEEISQDIQKQVTDLIESGVEPHLAVVLVGDNPDSLLYVDLKCKKAKQLGIIVSVYHIESGCGYQEIEDTLKFLSSDPEIQGIVLQLPLPDNFSEKEVSRIIDCIAVAKDVDGLRGDYKKGFQPPIVAAITSLLTKYDISYQGKKIVVVGRGRLVGQPVYQYFHSLGENIQMVHTETDHIFQITQAADILITGTGEPNLITYQWIKEGAVVINCANDVHEDSVNQLASAVSPAKGGIGPLTVIHLLANLVKVCQ